jgi:hypothetical protein
MYFCANFISMERTNLALAEKVLKKLEHISPVLHDVLEKAVTQARLFFEARGQKVDSSLFPCMVRYEAKLLLDSKKYRRAGYTFTVLSSNGLLVIYDYEGCLYRIRVRKADEEGDLPTDNLSKTLKDFYNQPEPYFPGFSPEEINESIISPRLLRLMIVWDVDKNFVLGDVFLACPKNDSGELHFADKIEHSATSIAATNTFDDTPEEIDIHLPRFDKTGSEDGGSEK